MPTPKQNSNFHDSVVGDLLDDTLSWIEDNLKPEDVFTQDTLIDWANDNIKKLDENKLENWAESNGYTKE